MQLQSTPAYHDLLAYFMSWPSRSFMSDDSRATLYSLIRLLRPKIVAEVGTLFAGTTEVMARALWENGIGIIHTTDPFGAERCPQIIAGWPRELQAITHFHALNSMDFFARFDQQKTILDFVLVDGNHEYEFASFDLQMAARLLRPGGIIVMDNAEQTGPYQASRAFLARNTAWRELGEALASYDPLNPFDWTRSSVPGTTFVVLQAPDHISIGAGPHSWGQQFIEASGVTGFSLDLPAQRTHGRLFYQAIFRAFGDGNRDGAELKSLGNVRLDLDGAARILKHGLAVPLHSDMATKHADTRFSFEVDLSWHADPGAPPLVLGRLPTPI